MKKQELIRKYEELYKEHSPFHEPVPYTSMVELFLKALKQLDEPQKVKIPQFVADWIEEARKSCKDVAELLEFDFTNEEVGNWFLRENPIDLVARAWLDGYEIEKEKRYYIRLKNVDGNYNYLNHIKHLDAWCLTEIKTDKKFRTTHTRKELEDAGFGEVFDSPLFEVEEVE